jgi:phage FluMu protein Com
MPPPSEREAILNFAYISKKCPKTKKANPSEAETCPKIIKTRMKGDSDF